MHGTQTCKTSKKFEKNTDFKPDKSSENKRTEHSLGFQLDL